ncbi:MAG TPA: hypothetical protein VOA87_09305 [Thermoanaerobaculia bacterium]|nr:hypothetical protein [Thermoanaerobaculia bacterium]
MVAHPRSLVLCLATAALLLAAAPLLAAPAAAPLRVETRAAATTGPCIPSSTVLCIDNQTGDQRFEISVTFSTRQSGGHSGNGQAIALASVGVTHGGLFWFFSQDNPEVLVKVLDGCPFNSRFWVFLSAATNVGFTVTVRDTVTANENLYINHDLNAAGPLEDTNAFMCP